MVGEQLPFPGSTLHDFPWKSVRTAEEREVVQNISRESFFAVLQKNLLIRSLDVPTRYSVEKNDFISLTIKNIRLTHSDAEARSKQEVAEERKFEPEGADHASGTCRVWYARRIAGVRRRSNNLVR